jgi:hypothetical protein
LRAGAGRKHGKNNRGHAAEIANFHVMLTLSLLPKLNIPILARLSLTVNHPNSPLNDGTTASAA